MTCYTANFDFKANDGLRAQGNPAYPACLLGARVLASIAAVFTVLLHGTALAEDARVLEMSFRANAHKSNPIIVRSNDGKTWDKIADTPVSISYDFGLKLQRKGYVQRWAVYGRRCMNYDCNGHPRLDYGNSTTKIGNNFSKNATISVSAHQLVQYSAGGIPPGGAIWPEISRTCNQVMANRGSSRDQITTHPIRISAIANTRVGTAYESIGGAPILTGDTGKSAETTLSVVCKAYDKQFGIAKPELTIKDFSVKRASSAPACPRPYKLDVTFRSQEAFRPKQLPGIRPDQAAYPVRFNVEVNGKKGPRIRRGIGAGKHDVSYSEEIKLDPGPNTIRVVVNDGPNSRTITRKVDCGPLRLISSSLSYNQTGACPKKVFETATFVFNQPGLTAFRIKTQDGLVVHKGNLEIKRHDDVYKAVNVRVFQTGAFNKMMRAEISGNTAQASAWTPLKVACPTPGKSSLTIAASSRTTCPKRVNVEAIYRIHSYNQSDQLLAEITCDNGQKKRKLVTVSRRTGGKMSLAFKAGGSRTINCKTFLVGYETRTTARATRDITCNTPPGAGDLTGEIPDHSEPGIGVKLRGNLTLLDQAKSKRCPRSVFAAAQISSNSDAAIHWSIDCKGGTKSGVSQPTEKNGQFLVSIKRAFSLDGGKNGKSYEKCVLRTVSPGPARNLAHSQKYFPCRNRDVDPGASGLTGSQTPTHNPSTPEPTRCRSGYKKVGNRCVPKSCAKGFKRVGSKCQKVSIVCPKGKVKAGGRCVLKPCRKGFKRVGSRCQKIRIVCSKGKIKVGNKCALRPCPRGTKRVGKRCKTITISCPKGYRKAGKRCVPKRCRKGKVRINGRCVRPAS